MRNPFKLLFFMLSYLRGVLRFNQKDYSGAQIFFEKALSYKVTKGNDLIFQYYGQTLLCLGKEEVAFKYLTKVYKSYDENDWLLSNKDEYKLVNDTLDALKHLAKQKRFRIGNLDYSPKIREE